MKDQNGEPPEQNPQGGESLESGRLCTGRCSTVDSGSHEHIRPDWHPEVVVVEFEIVFAPWEFFPAQVMDTHGEEHGQKRDSERVRSMISTVRQILAEHNAVKADWTFSFNSPDERAELDRERFLSFFFPPVENSNLWLIADELAALDFVVYAAPEPTVAPPSALLDEPLAVDGGVPHGIAVIVNPQKQIQNQWYLFRCRAAGPLSHGVSGSGVIVADIDWGFRVSHQDLQGQVSHSWNITNNTPSVSQGAKVSHGTGVLGILAAADNNRGMAGFAPGAKVWAIQADDGTGTLNNNYWVKAIDYARSRSSGNARKIIMIEVSTKLSGNIEASQVIRKAIINALDPKHNIVVCVTAGNGGKDADFADDKIHAIPRTGSILIGATQYKDNPNDIRRGDSNYGRRVLVSAPGDSQRDVTCCNCGDTSYTNRFGGTSGAAPKVAGAIALMLQVNKTLTHNEVRQILGSCGPVIVDDPAKPIGRFLDVEAAVAAAKNFKRTPPPKAPKSLDPVPDESLSV